MPWQALRQFVEQFLLAFVFKPLSFFAVALHQFAQAFNFGKCLLPGLARLIEIVLVPVQTLPLLINSRIELREKPLKTQQPLPGHAGAAAHDPLLGIIQTKGIKVGEFAFGHLHLALKVTEALHGGFLGFFSHVHHRRQTRGSTDGSHDRLPARRWGEQGFQVGLAFTHVDFVVEPLTLVAHQLRVQGDRQIGFAIATGNVSADADQVAALLIA